MSRNLDELFPEEKPKDPNIKRKVFISFVIDESGSMQTGKDATINGMNEQIQMIKDKFKDSKIIEPIISVIKFNHNVTPLFINKTLNDLIEFSNDTYTPNGKTAMYDAMGYTLDILENAEGIDDDDSTVLVVVVSDGQENSSTKYNSKYIAEKIKNFNKTNRWTFTYLGANQDLSIIQQDTNIYIGNIASFNTHSSDGYAKAFSIQSSYFENYLTNINKYVKYQTQNFYTNFSKSDFLET